MNPPFWKGLRSPAFWEGARSGYVLGHVIGVPICVALYLYLRLW